MTIKGSGFFLQRVLAARREVWPSQRDSPETDKYQWENTDDALTSTRWAFAASHWISNADEGDALEKEKS